ncbi:DNA-directed primase/polymerase protein [Saccopteryx bilineata]|uniref:DNA-directed primase/polymerase protein n=1 Tax=Saccopteryx bilineata TaxID=59482 RepID=UPI00338EF6AC
MKRKWEAKLKQIADRASQYERKPLPSVYRPRLSKPEEPPSVWKLFPRQTQAFNFVKSCKEDVHVFALEYKVGNGQRVYLVTTYAQFWFYYKSRRMYRRNCGPPQLALFPSAPLSLTPSPLDPKEEEATTDETMDSEAKSPPQPSQGVLSDPDWDGGIEDTYFLEATEDAELAEAAENSLPSCNSGEGEIPDELIIEVYKNSSFTMDT